MEFIIESKCNKSYLTSVNSLCQNNESKNNYQTWIPWVSFIICSLLLFDVYELLLIVILNSLFTDSLHFPTVFTHGFIQLFFNVTNRIKIINQVWLGLLYQVLLKTYYEK